MQIAFGGQQKKGWLVLIVAALFLSVSPTFAIQPEDWSGRWNLFLSKAHPSTVPKTLIISDKPGDCAGLCLSVVIRREGEATLRGDIVRMDNANRHAVFEVRGPGESGKVQYDAHMYTGGRLVSGTYKNWCSSSRTYWAFLCL